MTAQAEVAEAVLHADQMTDYDRSHLKTYARLLDAASAGADWREVAAIVLRLDVACDEARARCIYDAHMARARWMTKVGYRDLLERPSTDGPTP